MKNKRKRNVKRLKRSSQAKSTAGEKLPRAWALGEKTKNVLGLAGIKGKALKEKIRELIVQGRRYFDGGDYQKALPYLKKVHELDGGLPDILNMLGLIYHSKGKFNQALQAFEEALTINPNYTEASLNLAVTCNDLGRFQEAKFVYSRACETAKPTGTLDPYVKGKLANMHAEIADVYQALGRHFEASEEFKKALSLRPTFVDIQTKMGTSLRELGRKQESLEILQTACKNDGDYAPAAINLGLTYFSMGQTEDAVKTWKMILKKDPDNEKAQMYLRLVKDN